MIVKEYIKNFEKLGFGMFVHFGLYSLLSKGEWSKWNLKIADDEYNSLYKKFNPKPDWAKELVKVAKSAGCKYITLTTRHHDGYSLYDTKGLSDFDSVHGCGRDLVREFVDACNAEGVIPFFYHTLLDWYHPSYNADFKDYLKYLRKSVEILFSNYGEIGGIWFDGMWNKPNDDWEEDELYSLIRSLQPNTMIINNTGLDARGELGHIELDSVTFERGRPGPINQSGAKKYVASEMCEVFCNHWGYAENDLGYKSANELIESIAICRRYGSNMLLNVGPMGDGGLRKIDEGMLELIGIWTNTFSEAIYTPRPTNIEIENKPDDFILKNGKEYYLYCFGLNIVGDPNVVIKGNADYERNFTFPEKIKTVKWLDSGEELEFTQKESQVDLNLTPYKYGKQLVVRVAKITVE